MDVRPGVLVMGGADEDLRGLRSDLPGVLGSRCRVEVVVLDAGGTAAGDRELARLATAPDGSDRRVAVVGIGAEGDAAVRVAAGNGRVAALVLVDAVLSAEAVDLVAEWPELPSLVIIDAAHRPLIETATEVHLASDDPDSDLWVVAVEEGSGVDGAPVDDIATWLCDRLASSGPSEVSLTTSDGWELRGDLSLPPDQSGVPGVVLLHSGFTDSSVYVRLARRLARRGVAVLNLDWRGRGRSRSRGDYFSLAPEEQAQAGRDAAAAFDFLAGLPEVDGDRLGAVGIAHGSEHAVSGALGDRRVRALALLTGYRLGGGEQREFLTSGDVEVLYVTGEAHRAIAEPMLELAAASRGRATRVIEYPGGAIGYQLFELHPDLEPTIVSWLADVLSA